MNQSIMEMAQSIVDKELDERVDAIFAREFCLDSLADVSNDEYWDAKEHIVQVCYYRFFANLNNTYHQMLNSVYGSIC